MFRQAFRKVLSFVGLAGLLASSAPAPRKSTAFSMPLPNFHHAPPVPLMRRRRNGSKMPESWHRFCRARAQARRDLRDANNAKKAIAYRMMLLRHNPDSPPLRFMPKIRWVKGGLVSVGGKFD